MLVAVNRPTAGRRSTTASSPSIFQKFDIRWRSSDRLLCSHAETVAVGLPTRVPWVRTRSVSTIDAHLLKCPERSARDCRRGDVARMR
jgi:hypothetical protein